MERLKGDDLMAVNPVFLDPKSSQSLSFGRSLFSQMRGWAHTNQYEVLITIPGPVLNTVQNPYKNFVQELRSDAREIQLRCESITLPGRNLSSTPDTNIHGPLREVVNNVNYADSVNMVFQASADLRERVFFEKWQYAAFNPDTWNVGYYNNYIGTVDIYVLDRENNRKYGLTLRECYPKSIAQTDLSYAANNEIIKLTIDMNFRYWTTLDFNQMQPRRAEAPETLPHINVISGHNPAVNRKLREQRRQANIDHDTRIQEPGEF